MMRKIRAEGKPVFVGLLSTAVGIGAASCSGGDTGFTTTRDGQGSQPQQTSAEKQQRARQIRGVVWPGADMQSDGHDNDVPKIDMGGRTIVGSEKWKNIVWLNFDEARVEASESFIVENEGLQSVAIGPFASEDVNSSLSVAELKPMILEQVGALFEGIDVEFVLEKPAEGVLHSVVHIGGRNFTTKAGLLGRSPLDFDNFSANDVIFVFSKEFSASIEGEAVTLLVYTIAHEVAHALGARHIDNHHALMHPVIGLEANDFQEEGMLIGESDEQGSENSFDTLVKNAGARELPTPESGLPRIHALATRSQGNIGQFSVFDLENISRNQGYRLGDYDYTWALQVV